MKFSTRAAALVAALMIFIGSFIPTASAEETNLVYGIGFVNASGLNLRQSPDTSAPVLTTANSGECVVVLGLENGWYHVNYNLQDGYMSADYLSVAIAENAELGYGTVSGSGVNLRSGPDTGYNRVATASYGEKCYIIGLNQGWYKVLYNSQTCYIRSDFLSLTEIPYENQASTATDRPSARSPAAPPGMSAASALSAPPIPVPPPALPFWPRPPAIWAPPMSTAALPPAALTAPDWCIMFSAPSASPWAGPRQSNITPEARWTRAPYSPATSCFLPEPAEAALPMPASMQATASSSTPQTPAATSPIPTSPAAIGVSTSTAVFEWCKNAYFLPDCPGSRVFFYTPWG